jgi:DNA-binding NtrC family response regulator
MRPFGDGTDFDLAARVPLNVMMTAGDSAARAAWAHAIHDRSARLRGPFVVVYPAVSRKVCAEDVDDCFKRAAGGTLFIDHVEQLSPDAQERLLSLLSEQSRHASGATLPPDYRVRIIAGSDRSLRADLAAGVFSDVLFYRLNVIHIDRMHQGQ